MDSATIPTQPCLRLPHATTLSILRSFPVALLFLAICSLMTVFSSTRDHDALTKHCARFSAFEPGIAENLLPWHDDHGIGEALMDLTLKTRTMRAKVPGLPLCFRNGALYVIDGHLQHIGVVWPSRQTENLIVYAHVSPSGACRCTSDAQSSSMRLVQTKSSGG